MEKHVRFSGGAQAVSAEDIRDRRFANHLEQYYAAVTALIRESKSILLLGPGEAKIELKHHLEREGLGERIVGIDTVDKMTDPQIAAKVRQYFGRLGNIGDTFLRPALPPIPSRRSEDGLQAVG